MRPTQTINLHLTSECHRRIKLAAMDTKQSMGATVAPALERLAHTMQDGAGILQLNIVLAGNVEEGYQLTAHLFDGTDVLGERYPISTAAGGKDTRELFTLLQHHIKQALTTASTTGAQLDRVQARTALTREL